LWRCGARTSTPWTASAPTSVRPPPPRRPKPRPARRGIPVLRDGARSVVCGARAPLSSSSLGHLRGAARLRGALARHARAAAQSRRRARPSAAQPLGESREHMRLYGFAVLRAAQVAQPVPPKTPVKKPTRSRQAPGRCGRSSSRTCRRRARARRRFRRCSAAARPGRRTRSAPRCSGAGRRAAGGDRAAWPPAWMRPERLLCDQCGRPDSC